MPRTERVRSHSESRPLPPVSLACAFISKLIFWGARSILRPEGRFNRSKLGFLLFLPGNLSSPWKGESHQGSVTNKCHQGRKEFLWSHNFQDPLTIRLICQSLLFLLQFQMNKEKKTTHLLSFNSFGSMDLHSTEFKDFPFRCHFSVTLKRKTNYSTVYLT